MAHKETPLMRQYHQIKKKHADAILFFRMGDFFETFEEDAVITARVCGITLTKRNNGEAGEVPLAGFPHHQLDAYLPKLVRAGYRVAVCEQLEDPKQARGIVRRDVVEVVTPGVAMYDKLLDVKRNNYVGAAFIFIERGTAKVGLSCADISTGEFFTMEVLLSDLRATLETVMAAELIIPKGQYADLQQCIKAMEHPPSLTRLEDWLFEISFARETLLRHFKTPSLKGFGIEEMTGGQIAAGAVLHYILETQKTSASQITKVRYYDPSEYMVLDYATRRNLELTFSLHDNNDATLIAHLDKTQSPMGGRLFKQWLTRPLRKLTVIQRRLAAVKALKYQRNILADIRHDLSETGDLERLIAKICAHRCSPRDIIALKRGLQKIPLLRASIAVIADDSLSLLAEKMPLLDELITYIGATIIDDPSASLGTGSVFRPGVSAELDEVCAAMLHGKTWVHSYQERLRQETGISTLKVGFNNVFGYYIEVTNIHKTKTPDAWIRKQTMTNAERYITPELKDIEDKILNAEQHIGTIEQRLFEELLYRITQSTEQIQMTAAAVAALDCLQSFATIAHEYNYCEPIVDESDILDIKDGRHPVVERLLPVGHNFVANSVRLDCSSQQIHIITGPNMSGKSCYLRQTALIVLLSHVGSFVPATSAHCGMTDRIFTRVGAQDNLAAGESTFLVEMQEAANILNNATQRSLILLDEVGRGTATFDGISIAWSLAEYLHEYIGAKTLFATHYHELNELADSFPRIHNYQVEVREVGDSILFTHRVVTGSTDHSFGIHVAQMAGLPQQVVTRAHDILLTLEGKKKEIPTIPIPEVEKRINQPKDDGQLSIFEFRDDTIRDAIMAVNINSLTPLQALQALADLQKKVTDN